jgi:hypothetical protein
MDGAAVLTTGVTDIRLGTGGRLGAWKGFDVALCVMKTAIATSSP